MSLPALDEDGLLPPGIHGASVAEVGGRYGQGSSARQQEFDLLQQVVGAAIEYATIKRILVWGSFVTARPDPQDLDYSLVVSVSHHRTSIEARHRRFLVAYEARLRYGVDAGYLVIRDYPLEFYLEQVDFLCHTRRQRSCGIVEISLRGEVSEP